MAFPFPDGGSRILYRPVYYYKPAMPRARRLPADAPPRERLLETAIDLLRRSGLTGAGINEIVRESGAPKGSVYHFFPGGKPQIVDEALARHSERVLAFLDEALSRGDDPAARVRSVFLAFAERLDAAYYDRSCPAGTCALDLDEGWAGLQERLGSMFGAWVELIDRRLGFGDARRSRSFAGLMLTAIEGAYVRGRAERSSAAFREAGEWLAALAAAPASATGQALTAHSRNARRAADRVKK
jgi:AcrR family transcriptional regulator